MADRQGLGMFSCVMPVHGSEGKGFLLDDGQITQDIFGIFTGQIQIQFHAVDTC